VLNFEKLFSKVCVTEGNDLDIRLISRIANNALRIIEVINQVFNPSLVQQHARLSIYMTLARPAVTHGSEAWIIRKADEKNCKQ
jgi:hypothetical protein